MELNHLNVYVKEETLWAELKKELREKKEVDIAIALQTGISESYSTKIGLREKSNCMASKERGCR